VAETIRPANPTPPPPPADQVFDAAEATAGTLADTAAEQVHATAEYFRDHDMKAVESDVKAYTREHPAQSLIGAAALGFLAAVLIRRT